MEKADDLIQKYGLTLLLEIDSSSDVLKGNLSFVGCEENLLFWREAQKFKTLFMKKSPMGLLMKQADLLLNDFIKSDGKHCIPMSTAMRKDLKTKIAAQDYSLGMFDDCLKQIENSLADGPFPNFAGKLLDIMKESWNKCLKKTNTEDFGKILFMNWFSIAPEAVAMFKSDMNKHSKMLIGMIETAINLLGDLKELIPKLVALGKRHVRYGVDIKFFEGVGRALVQTIGETLDKVDFTPEVKSCWEVVFKMMSTIMIHSMERSKGSDGGSEAGTTSTGGKKRKLILKHGLPLLLSMEHTHAFLKGNLVYYYKDEMLNFWRETYDFRQMDPVEDSKAFEDTAKHIFTKYVANPATCSALKIPDAVAKKIATSLDKINPTMFDNAIEAVEKEMEKRPFPRFSHTIGKSVQVAWDELNEKLSSQKIGKILFMNFFMKDPSIMPLFKRDVEKHGAMLAGIIDMAIGSIGDLKSLLPSLIQLGTRHKKYGTIKQEHFTLLREAMIETFAGVLKENFTDEMKESWRVIYDFLAAVMQSAMSSDSEEEEDGISDKASQDSRDTDPTSAKSTPAKAAAIAKKKPLGYPPAAGAPGSPSHGSDAGSESGAFPSRFSSGTPKEKSGEKCIVM